MIWEELGWGIYSRAQLRGGGGGVLKHLGRGAFLSLLANLSNSLSICESGIR